MKIKLTREQVDLIILALQSVGTSDSYELAKNVRDQTQHDLTGKTFVVEEEDFIKQRNERMLSGTVSALPWDWNPNDPRNW